MNGFNPFLAEALASYQAAEQLSSQAPAGPPPPPAAPPPAPAQPWAPQDPLAKPAGVMTGYDPLKGDAAANPVETGAALAEQAAAPGPTANTNAVPGGPGPAVNVNGSGAFPLTAVGGGGVVPAHEVDLRGPSLKNAQADANGVTNYANELNVANSQSMANDEFQSYLAQERDARAREAAWQQSMAERDEEMSQRQADFDQSVKALSQTSIDPNRFWSTRSTGQKISAMIGLALGGFLQGARGGNNPGMDVINTAIDRDVRAQEAQFQVARDVVGARQTAFALAAQKYQNVDAARAMARAASIDAVQAQLGQNAALWKDTEAANRANIVMAQLEQEKMAQIAQGIRFILPQTVGRTFVDSNGLRYTEAEAKALSKELRGYEQEREKIGLKAAGDVMTEGAKGQVAAQKDMREQMVTLSNGDTIQARSGAEAQKLSDLSATVDNAKQLVARAKAIRASGMWRVNPSARAELSQIQSELTVAFKEKAGLGALSGGDFSLANSGTGDLFSLSPGVDAQLDSFSGRADKALRNRVKTIPGVSATAKGELPADAAADFKAYGKK